MGGRGRQILKEQAWLSRSLPWTALVPTDWSGIGGGPEEQTRPAAHPASLAPSTSLYPLAGGNNASLGGKEPAMTDIRVLVGERRRGRSG